MRKDEFARYLREVRGHGETTVQSRLANCASLEEYEGDLDALFDRDRMEDLIDRLAYSAEDERRGHRPRHEVPIGGEHVARSSATLKYAARLYRDFRAGGGEPRRRADSAGRKQKRAAVEVWLDWQQPSEDDMLRLTHVLARHTQFLRPEIIEAVVEDNVRHASEWRTLLAARGVDPDIYLWGDSPCAFPGVRRYAGSDEQAQLSKRVPARAPADDCLILDRNNYPKHLWAFALTGKEFRNRGPNGYQLAHLADHKEYKTRWQKEFNLEGSGSLPRPFGLFTSAANTIFVPNDFLRPTDSSPRLRALLLRRAYRLYGGVCRLAPPPLVEKPPAEGEWDPDDFEWAPPVGTMEHMPAFLKFRRERIAKIAESSNRPR